MSEIDDELVLKLPYARLLLPDTDGSWFATIIEFPGCFAVGDTPAEAATVLEEVAIDWLASSRRQGQSIPDPLENDKHDLPSRIASLTARVSELEGALATGRLNSSARRATDPALGWDGIGGIFDPNCPCEKCAIGRAQQRERNDARSLIPKP